MAVRDVTPPSTWTSESGHRHLYQGVGLWTRLADGAPDSLGATTSNGPASLPWLADFDCDVVGEEVGASLRRLGGIGVSVSSWAVRGIDVRPRLSHVDFVEVRCPDESGLSASQKLLGAVRDARLAVSGSCSSVAVGWSPTADEQDDIAQLRVLRMLLDDVEHSMDVRSVFYIAADIIDATDRTYQGVGELAANLGSHLVGPTLGGADYVYVPHHLGLTDAADPGYITSFSRQFLDLHAGQRTDGDIGRERLSAVESLLDRSGLSRHDWVAGPIESLVPPAELTI